MRSIQVYAALLYICFMLSSCASSSSQATTVPAAITASPTIAAVAAPIPAPLASRGVAPATVSIPKTTPTAMPGGFNYFWPAYIPEGMQIAAQESRVAGENEIGRDNLGFFLLTFSGEGGKRKLSLGGGAVEAFQLQGERKQVQLGSRSATLVTLGEQHLILLEVPVGTLFVLGAGLSEDEVVKVAASLEPTDVRAIRQRLGQ